MSRDADDDSSTDETPPRATALDSATRRPRHRAPATGVPALVIDRPSRAVLQAALEAEAEDTPTTRGEVEAIVRAELQEDTARRFRRLWQGLAGVAGAALMALLAAGKGMLSDARAEGESKVRIEVIERDLERGRADLVAAKLEIDALRALVYRVTRRDDQPDPPITAASKRTAP